MRKSSFVPWLVILGLAAGAKLVGGHTTSPEAASVESQVYYPRCADARAAEAAPIYAGQPGYRDALDADGDGIACEPYLGG